MKKSLLALAVLGAFASAASAQSSVTMYGRIDLAVARNIGSDAKVMQNGSGSRLGLRGSEDLGGGMSAIFNIETRFDADTGATQNMAVRNEATGVTASPAPNRFWSARSIVGLKGNFGQIVLGREYTTSFLMSQLINDPWGYDTVVNNSGGVAGVTGVNSGLTGAGIAKVRNDSALTYNFSAMGFSFGAQVAEATDTINTFQKRPYNLAVGYAGGPFAFNASYERTGDDNAGAAGKVGTIAGSFALPMVKLGASYAKGTVGNGYTKNALGTILQPGADSKAYLITAVAPLGQGELRASYGERKMNDIKDIKGFALGYHYALSKRTTVYTDVVRNGALAANKVGYDFGLKHSF